MPDFVPGLELARSYYVEYVRPILDADWPNLVHSAGLIGPGSEVLGFDTEMSTDHNWGAKAILYLSPADHAHLADDLRLDLGHKLPLAVRGWPTHFEEAPDDPGTVIPRTSAERPINHQVHVTVLHDFVRRYTGIDLDGEILVLDWLTTPEQNLRTLAAGAVFHDGLNVLAPMRQRLAYYPHDVWLYLLSAQWQRIGQEEPFVGRTGVVDDDLGSVILASRLVRDLMRLFFLMERTYTPYAKWFGTAFFRLECAGSLAPIFDQVLRATSWQDRERHLCAAYEIAAARHNELGITQPLPVQVSQFHSRPFRVIQGESFARAIWKAIRDPEVKALPFGVGKVDQYVDSTDLLSKASRCRAMGAVYAPQSNESEPG